MPRDFSSLRAVLFDWDGTLLNSYASDAQAYLEMFSALGIDWGLRELKQHYSPNWHRIYRAAKIPHGRWEEADQLWHRFYRRRAPALQPGAWRVLVRLDRQFTLGLVSSGSRARVRAQMKHRGVAHFFQTRICSEDAPRRKPHPAPLQMALERLRVPAKESVYIGDSPEDVEMAHRAGVAAIGILGGSPVPARLRAAAPDVLIRTIADLPDVLIQD